MGKLSGELFFCQTEAVVECDQFITLSMREPFLDKGYYFQYIDLAILLRCRYLEGYSSG